MGDLLNSRASFLPVEAALFYFHVAFLLLLVTMQPFIELIANALRGNLKSTPYKERVAEKLYITFCSRVTAHQGI